jgi:predicted deacylase
MSRWRRCSAGCCGRSWTGRAEGSGSRPSRNWFYREFGAPAVTYEVGDDTDPEQARTVAAAAARAMMALLLEELEGTRW